MAIKHIFPNLNTNIHDRTLYKSFDYTELFYLFALLTVFFHFATPIIELLVFITFFLSYSIVKLKPKRKRLYFTRYFIIFMIPVIIIGTCLEIFKMYKYNKVYGWDENEEISDKTIGLLIKQNIFYVMVGIWNILITGTYTEQLIDKCDSDTANTRV